MTGAPHGASPAAPAASRAAPVACRSRQPAALARLVCYPHAGGGPMVFRGWPRGLAPDVEVWNVTLPGRAGRAAEPFARDWGPLVEDFAEAIADDVPEPVALFGHSLGAALAFEVARALTRLGAPPAHLFVSARDAPDTPQPHEVPETDEELIDEVDRAYSGVPDAVRGSRELLQHFLPILRADLELAVAYEFAPGRPLGCPITALAGSTDPTTTRSGLEAWAAHTSAGFELLEMPGGHFYLGGCEPAVLETIHRRLMR